MIRVPLACAAGALLALGLGCGDDEKAPYAPDHDGGYVGRGPIGSGRSDAGTDGSVPDGSTVDAGLITCLAIEPGDETNSLLVTQVGYPDPFVLRNAFIRWNDVVCDPARLLIGLTDGACLPGVGQQLLVTVDRDAVGASVVEGDNVLSTDATLRVQFSRPVADSPNEREVFGTCSVATDGVLTFEDLGVDAGDRERALFSDLQLAQCVEPGAETTFEPVAVTGAFDLLLPSAHADVCP